MKIAKHFLLALITICYLTPVSAQKKIQSDIYRRNSLCTYFISDINLLVSEDGVDKEIKKFLDNYVISDKYDDHTIGSRYVSVDNISFTDEDRCKVDPKFAKNKNKKPSKFESILQGMAEQNPDYERIKAQQDAQWDDIDKRSFASSHPEIFSASTQNEYEENTQKTAAKIYKYLSNNKFANQLIAKWFNAKDYKSEGSHYDLSLIQERGLYNASELDVMRASETTRKWAILKDAGMELIPHTFVSFTQFEIIDGRKYQERQNSSDAGKDASKMVGKMFGKSQDYMDNLNKDTEAETAGYYITSTTYLFQLEWTNETLEKFINEYWDADLSKLMNSDEFSLKYLGYKRNTVNTTESVMGKGKQLVGNIFKEAVSGALAKTLGGQSDAEIAAERRLQHDATRQVMTLQMTEQSLIRSIDATYLALQKAHEEFKVKAPLIDVEKNNITAFIGLKEGVTAKTEFEVLERTYNKKKEIYEYKKVGKLKVDKKRIWDNRYTLIDEGSNIVGKGKNATTIDRTYLTGSASKIAPGMLLRQIR